MNTTSYLYIRRVWPKESTATRGPDKKINDTEFNTQERSQIDRGWGHQGQCLLSVNLPDFAPFRPVTPTLILQALLNRAS